MVLLPRVIYGEDNLQEEKQKDYRDKINIQAHTNGLNWTQIYRFSLKTCDDTTSKS